MQRTIVEERDGIRISHALKHAITSLALLLVSLVMMLTIEIFKHQMEVDNVFTKVTEHVATALFIAGVWHCLHEFFVKREFIKIHDRGIERVLDAVATARQDAAIGLISTCNDVKEFSYLPFIDHPAPLTVVLNDGGHWVSDHIDALRKRLSDPLRRTKFLLIHPESSFIEPLCSKIGWEPDEYRNKILKTVRELRSLGRTHGNIEILGHRTIVYQSLFFSHSDIVMTPYFLSSEKQTPPVLVFRDDGQDSFGAKLKRDIAALEKQSVDISTYSQPLSSSYYEHSIPIGGDRAVCKYMMDMLNKATAYLDVTHVAKDRSSVDYIGSVAFREWIKANYLAARGDGRLRIRIRRIFLIDRRYEDERSLLDTMRQMVDHGIEVFSLSLDDVPPSMQEDFSLYDDAHVLFRHHRHRSWISDSGVSHSSERETISAFRSLFDKLLGKARPVL